MIRPKDEGRGGETLTRELAPGAAASVVCGSAEWFSDLVHQHLRRVFGVLYRMVGNRADAQDLAQEVFLKAFQRRHQLRDPDRALAWLLRIASNAAIDFQRARAGERSAGPALEDLELWEPEATPEQLLVRKERERRLHDALRQLSPKERAAIVLRDLEGWSGREVARALDCSQITVRTHIASARIKLRRFLARSRACGAPQ